MDRFTCGAFIRGALPVSPHVLTFVFTASLPGPESMNLLLADGKIVNTAYAGRIEGTYYFIEDSDSVIICICRRIFLPLALQDFSQ